MEFHLHNIKYINNICSCSSYETLSRLSSNSATTATKEAATVTILLATILLCEKMCIAVWLWESHPQYRLLLALNRDEFFDRPTEAVHWWEGEEILGGRDGKEGGTWLASSRNGRLAFVTNFREPTSNPLAKSRGELVTGFLRSSKTPMEFAQEISQETEKYNGFNLILVDLGTCKMAYVTNRHEGTPGYFQEVSPGLHVLSNGQLDTPWPKVQRLRNIFEDLLQKFGEEEIPEIQIVENAMKDTVKADKAMLPNTGYGPDYEYNISSIFVDWERVESPYGTRSVTVLSVKHTNELTYYEQRLEDGKWKENRMSYEIVT